MFRWTIGLGVWVVGLCVCAPAYSQGSSGRRPPRQEFALPGPAPAVGSRPLLPRYWLLADSAEREASAEVFSQYLSHFVHYPSSVLPIGFRATIYALISVLPNGKVESIAVTRRDIAPAGDSVAVANDLATAKAVTELDAALRRVVWQLQFKPATMGADSVVVRADTVTIAHRFAPQ